MRMPFRYQFTLAPLVIVMLLACLVWYTLIELANIRRENEETVRWEIETDRIQTAIANVSLLDRLVEEMAQSPPVQQEEHLFNYLEQVMITTESLKDLDGLSLMPVEVGKVVRDAVALLREPEGVAPERVHESLAVLLPSLQYQHKLILANRRSAFIDYHRNLSVIVPRLSSALLSVLVACIVLASVLAFWSLRTWRRRLHSLQSRAQAVYTGDLSPLPTPSARLDELDELEHCLAQMTQRMLDVVSVEKVLQGAEDERRRIAMEMHDGVLADLTALKRKLDGAASADGQDGAPAELQRGIDEVIRSIRRSIDDLHPQTLEILGLESALQSFLDQHCSAPGQPAGHLEVDPQVEAQLASHQKINVFRIVTEAIQNALRHARCSRYEVCLRLASGLLHVTIEDNGIGMPANATPGGHGCANITERARALGASVAWRSSRFASGTCVALSMPLEVVV